MKKKLSNQQRALVERHLDFALWVSRATVARYPNEADDIHGEAYLELVESALRFDPSRGFQFTTYADRRIRWSLFNWVRVQEGKAPIGRGSDGDELDPLDLAPARGTDGAALVDVIRSICPERQAQAMVAVIVEGKTHRETAQEMGVSRSAIAVWRHRTAIALQSRYGSDEGPLHNRLKNSLEIKS
jgi:RNA polymerase sigma factor (sigma-70 family)